MAQNRQLESEEQVSSSEEDEALPEEHEESESDEEEEKEGNISPNPPSNGKKPSESKKAEANKTLSKRQSSSSGDSESGSESDTSSGDMIFRDLKPGLNAETVASKRTKEPPKASKNPRSRSRGSVSAAPSKSRTASKRENENKANRNDEKASKKAKKKASDDGDVAEDMTKKAKKKSSDNGDIVEDKPKKAPDDSKKQSFRLWNEENEISLLEGLIEYIADCGPASLADMNAFYDFMKNKLQIVVSKSQLSDKVRRLKDKYKKNSKNGKTDWERVSAKDHELKAYELSKKVWSTKANGSNAKGSTMNNLSQEVRNTEANRSNAIGSTMKNHATAEAHVKAKAEAEAKASKLPKVDDISSPDGMDIERNAALSSALFGKIILDSCLGDEILKDGIKLIDEAKRLELEEKCKQLRVEEVELFLKRVELIREQTTLMLEALKSSGN